MLTIQEVQLLHESINSCAPVSDLSSNKQHVMTSRVLVVCGLEMLKKACECFTVQLEKRHKLELWLWPDASTSATENNISWNI